MTVSSVAYQSEIVHIAISRRVVGRPGVLASAELQARRVTAERLGVDLHLVSPARLLPTLVAGQPGQQVYSYECSVTVSSTGS